jgi:hypothetical protein
MTTSTVTYYRETLSTVRTAGTAKPAVNSGNQVKITSDIPTATASMIRQSTSIESRVSYTATFRKRRLLLDIDLGPVTSTPSVTEDLIWSGEDLVWSTEQLVWT